MTTLSRPSVSGLGKGRRILLFVDRHGSDASAAETLFATMEWPKGSTPEVIDIATDQESARWYGITKGPAIAVVCDGVLIAIEHNCDEQACTRVRQAAARRDPRAFEGLLLL